MKTKEYKNNKRQNFDKSQTNKEIIKLYNNNNEKEYKIEFTLLKELKKLKINLVVLDKNNLKSFYSKGISFKELIQLNKFFSIFQDYSQAFEYLIKNYKRIDKSNIISSQNKQINILLLFSVEENNNIHEESIELTLKKKNNNKSKYLSSNLSNIINNLKMSLENFNSSIKEIKITIDKDKIEKENKINTFEKNINIKINKNSNEESNYLINDKLINKINNLEEKIKLLENVSDKGQNKNETKINLNNIEKIIEDKINKAFDNKIIMIDDKLQIINNKVINLERGQNKLYEKNRNEESFIKDGSFNFGDSIIYDKYDKKIQNINNNINSKIKKLANKLNINLKDLDLENPDNNNNIIEEKTNDLTNNDNKDLNIKMLNELSNKIRVMNLELESKIKNIEVKYNEAINNKNKEVMKEIYALTNKINERGKEDYKDLNNKIGGLKNELIKIIDTKNNTLDNKIKIIDSRSNKLLKDNQISLEKLNYIEIKLKNIDNKTKQIDSKIENSNNNININNSYVNSNSRNAVNSLEGIDVNNQRNTSFSLTSNLKTTIQEIDSNIITKEEKTENFFLFSKMKEENPYNRVIKYSLVYRATRDGDSSKIFHSKCDFIGPNLTLIKTKKDFIFGGFTYKGWKHLFKDIKKDEPEYGTEIKDEKAFVFSINEKKIYKNGKPDEPAIYCNNNFGPVFKNNCFKIYDEFLKNGGICGKIEESNFVTQEKEYEINGGEEKFDIKEIEVFQISFK